jgi:hypothetical protein
MKSFLWVALIFVSSCAFQVTHKISEKMLFNGDWELRIISNHSCEDIIKVKTKQFNKDIKKNIPEADRTIVPTLQSCQKTSESVAYARALDLCPGAPSPILYGCTYFDNSGNPDHPHKKVPIANCYLKCK